MDFVADLRLLSPSKFWRTIFQAWKVMENSKGHGKSWKTMIMSWNVYNWTDCCEIFVNMCKYTGGLYLLDSSTTSSCNCHY